MATYCQIITTITLIIKISSNNQAIYSKLILLILQTRSKCKLEECSPCRRIAISLWLMAPRRTCHALCPLKTTQVSLTNLFFI